MIERLSILRDSSVIDAEVFDDCIALDAGLMTLEGLTKLDAYQVAMTHLAMAMQRIKKDNVVDYMDEMILSEIKSSDLFSEVVELTDKIVKQVHVDIPESEVQFLWLHMLNTLNEKGGK